MAVKTGNTYIPKTTTDSVENPKTKSAFSTTASSIKKCRQEIVTTTDTGR